MTYEQEIESYLFGWTPKYWTGKVCLPMILFKSDDDLLLPNRGVLVSDLLGDEEGPHNPEYL